MDQGWKRIEKDHLLLFSAVEDQQIPAPFDDMVLAGTSHAVQFVKGTISEGLTTRQCLVMYVMMPDFGKGAIKVVLNRDNYEDLKAFLTE